MSRISNVRGAHLTATDRRNIRALIDRGFENGRRYRIGRKVYALTATGWTTGGLEVTVEEAGKDDWGRREVRTYRSTFETAA